MRIVRDLPTLREIVAQGRMAARTVAFVPTMGALHEGHLSLVRLAKAQGGITVVSIFVNPLQFGPNEDLSRYPRREKDDSVLLEAENVDVLYLPTEADLYPPDFSTVVDVAGVSEGGEGAMRPGHFRGVATVVLKLFLRVLPDVVVMGRKDLQQVAIVRRMLRDLDLPIRLVVGDTIRDADGLAMSSRNAYLSPEDRRRAADFPRTLLAARARAEHGATDARRLEEDAVRQLEAARFQIDYVEAVDAKTMRRVEKVVPGTALAGAVRLGTTRLIDNVYLLDPPAPPKR